MALLWGLAKFQCNAQRGKSCCNLQLSAHFLPTNAALVPWEESWTGCFELRQSRWTKSSPSVSKIPCQQPSVDLLVVHNVGFYFTESPIIHAPESCRGGTMHSRRVFSDLFCWSWRSSGKLISELFFFSHWFNVGRAQLEKKSYVRYFQAESSFSNILIKNMMIFYLYSSNINQVK